MILILNGTFRGIHWTNFTQSVQDYTSAFDLLSGYVARGLQLHKATLIDQNNGMELPIECFDGRPFSAYFDTVQIQWEQVLQEHPLSLAALDKQRMINWHRQLIAYYDQQINLTIQGILRLGKKIKTTTSQPETMCRRLITSQYQMLMQSYYERVNSLETTRQNTAYTLKKLEDQAGTGRIDEDYPFEPFPHV